MRVSYSGNTLAFQAKARSSILLTRSNSISVLKFYLNFKGYNK